MFWPRRNDLFERTLGRVGGWLADEGYVGSIDLNCIVNETGIYLLEFTPRFGYPTITLQEEATASSTGEFFHEFAHGRDPEFRVHGGYQIGVRVVLPPLPFDDQKTYDEISRNAAIVFASDPAEGTTTPPAGVHIQDAKRVATRHGNGEPCDPRAREDGQW